MRARTSHSFMNWSERCDSNTRPSAPKADALPGCATLRRFTGAAYTLRRTRATAARSAPFLLDFRGANMAPFLDSQGLGASGIQLDHELHRLAGRNGLSRIRHGVFPDTGDGAIGAHEQHVQRQDGVLHPEAHRLRGVEIEQHAGVR